MSGLASGWWFGFAARIVFQRMFSSVTYYYYYVHYGLVAILIILLLVVVVLCLTEQLMLAESVTDWLEEEE